MEPSSLSTRLHARRENSLLRRLTVSKGLVDLCSNDYLGVRYHHLLRPPSEINLSLDFGSTGSRLLSGNSLRIEAVEGEISRFHGSESALIFNSGYDANVGLLSSVPQRGDTVLYDELSHASIRDGIRLGLAKSYSFRHNDLDSLNDKIARARGDIYIAVESIYSMDGDAAPLKELALLAERSGAYLIVDEAHATGIYGEGRGLVQELGLEKQVFARVYTFGKALGVHGAAVVGSGLLREFLINFARSFIYTTALSPHSVEVISQAYALIPTLNRERELLFAHIKDFRECLADLSFACIKSASPIQSIIVPGNIQVRAIASSLQERGFDLRPILSPTVPEGSERLRISIHSFNTKEELTTLATILRELHG